MFIKKWLYRYLEIRYGVGFFIGESVGDYSPDKVKWLNLGNYKDGWFADPFILSYNYKSVELLVEEWEYTKKKGRLSLLDIDIRNGEYFLKNITPILSLATHLSFPIPIVENDKIYVYPENNESGHLYLYEYDRDKKILKNPILIIDEPLVDTQIVKIADSYYAFAVLSKTGKLSDTCDLQIYKSSSLFGPYTKFQTIHNKQEVERGAGIIYKDNGMLIRPSQICHGGYGLGIILNELTLTTRFEEREHLRLNCSPNRNMGQALHTINRFENLYVVDGRDYRYYWRGRIVNSLINILKVIVGK